MRPAMKKIAFFVEGQTEKLFLRKLLAEIAGRTAAVQLELRKGVGRAGRRWLKLEFSNPRDASFLDYHVLIVDSSNCENVLSDMIEQQPFLQREGYSAAVALRDAFDGAKVKDPSKVPALERSLEKYACSLLSESGVPWCIVLAVMEIEAWFVAEFTHFERIDRRLTCQTIKDNLGFDPSTDDAETLAHPAVKLAAMYAIVGEHYVKRKAEARRTVKSLDYAHVYVEVEKRAPRIRGLLNQIDLFFGAISPSTNRD